MHKSLYYGHQFFKSHKKVENTEEETIKNSFYCLLPLKGEGKKNERMGGGEEGKKKKEKAKEGKER